MNASPLINPATARPGWRSQALTHVGKVRTLNEDRFLDMPEHGLWAVADGMGGHDAGDIAATATVRALATLAETAEMLTIDLIENALLAVNRDIYAAMQKRRQVGGCTVAGLLVDNGQAHVFWAGDSRVYRYGRGELEQLTHDHSVVQEMMDAGLLSASQAAHHPRANVITRALGVADKLELEVRTVRPVVSGGYFLCSDGITNELDRAQLEKCLSIGRLDAAGEIMTLALAAGARDNLTVIDVLSTKL